MGYKEHLTTMKVDRRLLDVIDKEVEKSEGLYGTRQEWLREAIREKLEKHINGKKFLENNPRIFD